MAQTALLFSLRKRSRFAIVALTLALSACGGDSGSDEQPSAGKPTPPSMTGTVSNGVEIIAETFGGINLTVKGSEGTARTITAFTLSPDYSVTLDQLSAPYLLADDSFQEVALSAPAVAAGTANLTPLTTLLVAWIVGQDPNTYIFSTLKGEGGVPAFTEDDVAEAQTVVTRYLTRVTGIAVDPTVVAENWVTTPMENAVGDAMYDQIVVLNDSLADQGSTLQQLSDDVAAQRQRCDKASVAISGSVDAYRFCQQDASSSGSDDGRIRTFDFDDVEGSTILVRETDGAVDSVVYTTREGRFACASAIACHGVSIGARTGEDTVPIGFDAVRLDSGSSQVTLNGTLAGAGTLPPLPCDIDKFYLIDPNGGVQGFCAYEGGSTHRGVLEDYGWGSLDFTQPYNIELIADGTGVSSIDVWWFDPVTGLPVTLYRCEGAACSGVTIGAPRDTVDSEGFPMTVRDFTLQSVPLVAVDAEGNLGSEVATRLSATLTDRVPYEYTADCSQSVEHNAVVYSDGTPSIDVCPPPPSVDPYDSYKYTYGYYDPDHPDAVDYTVASNGFSADGSSQYLQTLNVVTSGDRVLKVFLTSLDDARVFSCADEACTGVSVSALDAQGRRTIVFDGTVLSEEPTRQLPPTGVTASVTGGFLSGVDPYFVPSSSGGRGAAASATRPGASAPKASTSARPPAALPPSRRSPSPTAAPRS